MTNDRQARAARAEKMRKERERADRRQRNTITVAIVAIVVVLIGAAGWGIRSISKDNQKATEVVEPRNLVEQGVPYPVEDDVDNSDTPVVETFEDFLCPACGNFEQVNGTFLQQQAASGAIQLRFMPFSFLHTMSTNDYSHRAMNIAMCALDQEGPDAFWAVHGALYANQPAEGGPGPEDAELISMAEDVGVEGLDSCVRTEKFVPWIDEIQDEFADDRKVSGTPTVHIDGKESDARTPADLEAAFQAASKS